MTVCCVCGTFADPTTPDEGTCHPLKVLIDGSAPTLPTTPCPGEVYTTISQPGDADGPFAVSAGLFDESCLPITDESGQQITLILV